MSQPDPDTHRLPAPPGDDAFRLLVQSVKDYAIFMLDREGYVLKWNKGAERIKGYLANEISATRCSKRNAPRVCRHSVRRA